MKNKIIILGLALIIAKLCSAGSVFEPTPLHNWNESSKRIDRVNLWPLFYYQNPNMSALWPMIDKRNDGHAFRPLYSVYKNGDELNVLWPLSSFNFKRHEYRVANVYYDKPDKLFIFPISYFNFYKKTYWFLNTYISKDSFIFFPMYFYEKNDHWCISFVAGKGQDWYSVMPPLWISFNAGTNDNSWFFGPLGMYNSNHNGTHKFSALFKLVDYKRKKDESELNILFFNNYVNNKYCSEMNFFYFSQYTKTKTYKEFYIFPFVQTYTSSNKNEKVIFPLYFSKKDKKKDYDLLIPIFYKSRNDKENLLITPLFGMLLDDKSQSLITPLISYKKGSDKKFVNALGMVYNHTENKKKEYSRTDIVWPVFNFTHRKDKKSVSAFPLFYKSSSSNENTLITPVYASFNRKTGKSVFSPFVSYGEDNNNKFMNILGMVYNHIENKKKEYSRTDIVWPVFNSTHNQDQKSVSLFPLFYKSGSSNKSTFITPVYASFNRQTGKSVFSPLVSYEKDNNKNFINFLGFGYNHFVNFEKNYKRTDVIWPLFNHTYDNGKTKTYFFPLFRLNRFKNRFAFYSPIVSFGKDSKSKNKFFNITGIVFHYRKTKNDTTGYFIWPLYQYTFRKNGSANHSFLYDFFEMDKNIYKRSIYDGAVNDNEMITQKFSRVFIFKNYKSGIKCKHNSLPVPKELKNKNGDLSMDKIKKYPDVWENYAKTNWWIQKYLNVKIPMLFSYQWQEKQHFRFNILYWLYESEWYAGGRGQSKEVQKRILWWFMNYNRKDENVSLDVFPFITYDKIPEKKIKQFSVFWRLFRWREEKNKKSLDVLFIPIRRDK